jgi:hypothetical protein
MKTLPLLLAVALSTFAAPVRVTFDEPVPMGDVLHQSATINYIYVDSEHLDVYSSIGQVRMCYPDTSIAATCPIQFTNDEVSAPAMQFIKETVPARFKAWAESLGEAR